MLELQMENDGYNMHLKAVIIETHAFIACINIHIVFYFILICSSLRVFFFF